MSWHVHYVGVAQNDRIETSGPKRSHWNVQTETFLYWLIYIYKLLFFLFHHFEVRVVTCQNSF